MPTVRILNDYCDRFLSSLYGEERDEDGRLWSDVYSWEWEEILEEFETYLIFCKEVKYYPTYIDFSYYLFYLEYLKIGNFFNIDIRKNKEFLDFALEIYIEVIKYLTEES